MSENLKNLKYGLGILSEKNALAHFRNFEKLEKYKTQNRERGKITEKEKETPTLVMALSEYALFQLSNKLRPSEPKL